MKMAKRRGNLEGSIYERSNGRWLAQVRIQGKRISKNFETQKECRNWVKQMQAQIETGLSWESVKLTLGEYLNRWLKDIEGSVRPKTRFQYIGIVNNHLIPQLGKIKLGDLQPHQVQQLYNSLREQGHSQRNVQLIHSVLHRALKVASKQGLIGRNPASAVALPKISTKEMKVLDDNQARQMMIAAAGHRYEALLHLAVTTGMRMGELLGLKWTDLDWASGILTVHRQVQRLPGKGFVFPEPKTKAGRRMIELGPNTIRLLGEHRNQQELESKRPSWQENGLIFPSNKGTPADQRNLNRIFKELLKHAGLPEIRFHDLRHTAATLMLLNGIPLMVVSRRLGHSKPSVTLDIYGHYLPGMQKEAATLMDELVTPISAKWQQIGSSNPKVR
ncbi:MAG: site-specific integrase [Anaerolineae bacterium]|nr:MAG: site-specific integrase [Anaerolineae bacterium]